VAATAGDREEKGNFGDDGDVHAIRTAFNRENVSGLAFRRSPHSYKSRCARARRTRITAAMRWKAERPEPASIAEMTGKVFTEKTPRIGAVPFRPLTGIMSSHGRAAEGV